MQFQEVGFPDRRELLQVRVTGRAECSECWLGQTGRKVVLRLVGFQVRHVGFSFDRDSIPRFLTTLSDTLGRQHHLSAFNQLLQAI
jgi:hypothetical protein